MPLTHQEALAHEVARDVAELAYHDREAARSRGVCMSGMGPTPFTPRTAAERLAAAGRALEAAERRAATPGARFMACIVVVQQRAERDHREATTAEARHTALSLHAAGELARACASRGIETEPDHASHCLDVITRLGGDVRTARAALADAVGAQLQAAE